MGFNKLMIMYGRAFSLKDNLLLSFLKISYLALRVTNRLFLGSKKKKNISLKKNIEFREYMCRFIGRYNMIQVDVPKYGYTCYCRTDNALHDMVIMTVHEDDMLQLFQPDKEDIVVDVGANLGRYTLPSSKRVGEKGKVIAIEGEQSHYEMLNKNLKLNKISNVIAINSFVGSGHKYLNCQDFTGTTNHETLNDHVTSNIIHVDSLDNILINQQEINEVNWIKIDVEGAELDVLKGAHNILANSKKIKLQIEIHGVNVLYRPVVELLKSYNFKIIFEKDDPGYRHENRVGAKQVIAEKRFN